MKFSRMIATGAAILAAGTVAFAAGYFPGWPIVGAPSYCVSQNTAGVPGTAPQCTVTAPAGPPALTGSELIPADTQATSGPTTVLIPQVMVGGFNAKKNKIIGGDFATNLWQRGTTPVSAASPTTAVLGADRFYAYSASTQVTVIKETAAADTIPASGLYASMRVQRPSAQTGTGAVCVGQVLDKVAANDLIGLNAVLSFYALAGANLSSLNSNLVATVAYYTAADSATPGTNTGTFAAGTITGYQAAVAGASSGTTGTVASGAATVPVSTTWTRYSVYAPIPTANASGTAVTGVGISICFTPVGTAGTNDWIELEGVQLQAMPSAVTSALAAGVTSPTGFERRTAAEEAVYQQYYTQSGGLGAEVNGAFYQAGGCQATGNANFGITFPTPMRTAPTAATSTLTAGGYSIKTAAAVTAIGTITLPAASVYGVTLNSSGACTATLPYQLVGTNTTGLILFSAEP